MGQLGVYFLHGDWIYVAATDGSDPNSGKHRYVVRYCARIPDAKGKLLATIDKTDEVWFYGGSSHPYRMAYEATATYPLLAAIEGVDGFGFWAFQWWQASEKIVWYNERSGMIKFGPTFLGLRDGYHDDRLLVWVTKHLKVVKMEQVASSLPNALLRIGETTSEIYRLCTIVNLNSPLTMNHLRRLLLEAAEKKDSR